MDNRYTIHKQYIDFILTVELEPVLSPILCTISVESCLYYDCCMTCTRLDGQMLMGLVNQVNIRWIRTGSQSYTISKKQI